MLNRKYNNIYYTLVLWDFTISITSIKEIVTSMGTIDPCGCGIGFKQNKHYMNIYRHCTNSPQNITRTALNIPYIGELCLVRWTFCPLQTTHGGCPPWTEPWTCGGWPLTPCHHRPELWGKFGTCLSARRHSPSWGIWRASGIGGGLSPPPPAQSGPAV